MLSIKVKQELEKKSPIFLGIKAKYPVLGCFAHTKLGDQAMYSSRGLICNLKILGYH